jgi:hypothetical protein
MNGSDRILFNEKNVWGICFSKVLKSSLYNMHLSNGSLNFFGTKTSGNRSVIGVSTILKGDKKIVLLVIRSEKKPLDPPLSDRN